MTLEDKYYKIIGNDLENEINKIENKIPTTQNRYGDYLKLLTLLIEQNISSVIAKNLLIKAGGNFKGVNDAYKIISI